MNRIEPLYMGERPFFLSYRTENRDADWRMYHAHQGCELLYVYEGAGTVTVENRKHPLKPGMLFFFQPYQLHQVEVPARADGTYIRTNLTFDPRHLEAYMAPFPKLQAFLRRIWKGLLTRQVFDLSADRRLPELFHEMEQSRPHWDNRPQDEEAALGLIAILRHLQRGVFLEEDAEPGMTEKASGHIEQMADWIETHYKEPFSLARMAEDCHLSPYHVSHLFKRYAGTTITDYIAVLRIREACALLAGTDKQVGDIAREVGSLGTPYFCQLFKKHKGVTPQTYRSMVRRAYER
ncbi:AraC family transcriptional regulator [Paenibacillus soyae]|uniref:AraC family transcriptional regulator n=1 Tax=Paenibacillus soyae TaxID=2969249 RepID=A0A9X2MYJ8_9BACL|nr:AraC family transcriptional regulator [Paenibacillus soyae]MCR2805842.1 AraC family transcriptional regulator [Paenibacillus soyae]